MVFKDTLLQFPSFLIISAIPSSPFLRNIQAIAKTMTPQKTTPYTVEVLIPHNYHCSSSFMYKYYIYETNIYSQLSSLHKGLSFLPLHNQKKNTVLQEENYLILFMNFGHKVGIRDDAPLLRNPKC